MVEEIRDHHRRSILLPALDRAWKGHLLALDDLKESIDLRGYGRRDPFPDYRRRSLELFRRMKTRFADAFLRDLYRAGAPRRS